MKYYLLYPELKIASKHTFYPSLGVTTKEDTFWKFLIQNFGNKKDVCVVKDNSLNKYLIVRDLNYGKCSMCGHPTSFFIVMSSYFDYMYETDFTQYLNDLGMDYYPGFKQCSEECTDLFFKYFNTFIIYKKIQDINSDG